MIRTVDDEATTNDVFQQEAMRDDDLSDDEDEDYVPPETLSDDDAEDADLEIEQPETALSTCRLTLKKRKAVDEAFASLFGSSAAGEETKADARTKKKVSKKQKTSALRREKLLADLFGRNEARKLLETAKGTVRITEEHASLRTKPLSSYLPNQTVVDIKKFAGQTMEIRRIGTAGARNKQMTSASDAIPITTAKTSSLDALLKEISGPTKISTVEKTASDWEVFKDKTELKEELETKAKGKDAFLEKKDFLQRVDVRQFDREKSQRDLERSSRGH